MNHIKTTAAAAALTLATLAACGGGSDSPSDPLASLGAPGVGVADKNNCPSAQQGDVWIDQRLGCMKAGTRFVDISSGSSSSTYADTAYVLNQRALDGSFNNILGTTGGTRYWSHFLCVRNAPTSASDGYRLSLGTDLMVAMGINNFSPLLPKGIGATTLGISSGGQPGVQGIVTETCDPAKHPVIVNYTTGLVESVNPAALSVQVKYTL